MIRCFALAVLVALSGCGPRQVARTAPMEYDNRSESSFVALGSVETVLDSLVADLRTQTCLTIRRGRDPDGISALSLSDPCPGQNNRAVVRVVDGGDGTVRGTTETIYSGASTERNLALLPAGALSRRDVPVFVVPIVERGQPACSTVEAWRAGLNTPSPSEPPPPDTTVVEVAPELIGGLEAFAQSVRYPQGARRAGAQGLTIGRFVVEDTGVVSCAELIVSLRPDLDAEALRAIREARLRPGTQNGRPVTVRMAIPIKFRILP
ncbi:MAG TPA: energy transducer TonB [Rubricoccaceae bacterium]|jgi:TonB family protein